MQDTIIKGTGNSRTIRTVPNALTIYPDWQTALQAMVEGTFPIDIGPLNEAGIETHGTDLIKPNLMTDSTETSIWGSAADRTVDAALAQLRTLISTAQNTANGRLQVQRATYEGTATGTYPSSKTIIAPSWAILAFVVGGNDSTTHGTLLIIKPKASTPSNLNSGALISSYDASSSYVPTGSWRGNTITLNSAYALGEFNGAGNNYDVYFVGAQ